MLDSAPDVSPTAVAMAGLLLASLLAAVAVYDFKAYRIPNALNAAICASALAFAAWLGWPALRHAAVSAVACALFLAAVAWSYELLRGRTGLGGGDVKLFGAGGAWVGIENAQLVMLVASCAALLWLLWGYRRSRAMSLSTRIAFGPFLALGIGSSWLLRWL